MAEKKRKPSKKREKPEEQKKAVGGRVKDEIWAIVIIAVGAFLAIALQTNAAGKFGVAVSTLFFGIFGFVAYFLPYYLIVYGILLFTNKAAHIGGRSIIFLILIYLMAALLNANRFIVTESISFDVVKIFEDSNALESGGVFGMLAGNLLVKAVGKPGLYIVSLAVIAVSLLIVINTPISQFFDNIKQKRTRPAPNSAPEETGAPEEIRRIKTAPAMPVAPSVTRINAPDNVRGGISESQRKILNYMKDDNLFEKDESLESGNTGLNDEVKERLEIKELCPEEINYGEPVSLKYKLPPIEFLNKGPDENRFSSDMNLQAKANKLEETLRNFNVDAKVIQVIQGPAVTRYEIQPNVGVKVSSIVRLADDIALNLEARSIRLEAPIPGKAAVGIEVENDKVNMVTLRDIVSSKEFRDSKSKITFAVGKDISGNAVTADLKEMPHMLIAGATGSGKSVCINSIIISILYKAAPDEVKLVLIDPKVVELRNYNGIPHLLIPVVTEPSKAAAALNWAVSEMTDRYKKFAEEGVRDLETFNASVKKKKEVEKALPQIVIVIDELADLMMAAPSQVEESICRLAQMARAAGMHLIVATQRPSVDIITGVIKANIPSRIAFAVSSQFDSRTILDMAGAEKLVGKGDMLFNPIGIPKPVRVQGTFISDSEVHKVIEYVKNQSGETEYASDVISTIERGKTSADSGGDELLDEAIETVVKSGQASASGLQRRFRIGYNRAARMIEMLEERGIIGPSDGSRPRQVLMNEEELDEINRGKKGLE